MFKKRNVKNVNKKRIEDIKDAIENEETKEKNNKTTDENSLGKRDWHTERTTEKKDKDNDEDIDGICKFIVKKKQKTLEEEKISPHLPKYKRLVNVTSYEKKNEKNVNESDLIYKGEPIESKNVGSYAVDTDVKHDHRSILERNIKICEDIQKGKLKGNVYRGIGAHEKALNVSKDSLAKNKYTGLYGPVRSSGTNVRMTLRVDYEPCICKDYKETGYCGFGDTCIFLHDRSDYKSGWKIEQEYEQKRKKEEALQKKKLEKAYERMLKKTKEREQKIKSGSAGNAEMGKQEHDDSSSELSSESADEKSLCDSFSDDDEESVPFACLSCKKKWTLDMNPSITECSHYFCEACFIHMFQKTKKCIQCGLQLSGIMNTATKIIDILNKKHKHVESDNEH